MFFQKFEFSRLTPNSLNRFLQKFEYYRLIIKMFALLPVDVKRLIAAHNDTTWMWLYYLDPEFKRYTLREGWQYCIANFSIRRRMMSLREPIQAHRQEWHLNERRHRGGDLPAVIYKSGRREYYLYGLKHRDGGPAVICADGSKRWYQHGLLHRDDGPALIDHDGYKEYYQYGRLHSINDKPAIIYPDGGRDWFHRGNFHRENGPARIWTNGIEEWYFEGSRHRLDGPAVIVSGMKNEYWKWGNYNGADYSVR